MNLSFFRLPQSTSDRTRNAIFVIALYLVVSALVGSYLAFQAIQTPSWQLWTAAIAVFEMAVSSLVALIVARRGRTELGVWVALIGSYVAALCVVIAVSGMGAVILAACALFSSMVAVQTLQSPRHQSIMSLSGVIVGVVLLLVDFLVKTTRVSISGFQDLAYFLIPLMLILFGIVIFRQYPNYSLRTKLILGITALVVVVVSVVAFVNDRSSRKALTNAADQRILGSASQTATRVDDLITNNLNIVRTEAEATEELAAFLALRASGQSTSADEADLASILKSFAGRDPQSITSYALLDSKGIDVADTYKEDVGVDKSNRIYFQTPMKTNKPYVSPVTISATRPGDTDLNFSSPVHDGSGNIVGVLRFSYSTKSIQDLITQANGLAGTDSFAVLLDENFIRLAHGTSPNLVLKSVVPLDPKLLAQLQAEGRLPAGKAEELSSNLPDLAADLKNMDAQPIFLSASAALSGSLAETAVVRLKTQPWILYFRQPQSVFLAPIEAQTRATLLLTVVIVLLAVGASAGLAQFLIIPITNLRAVAEKIAAGDLNIEARVESEDEIGTLAKTFNAMTAQLRGLVGTLESRVAERTHSLELAVDVGRSVSQVRTLDVMLKDATEIIRTRFNLYYVQVYLTNPSQTALVLKAGTGTAGEQLLARSHQLPINTTSINGRAVIAKRSVVISDTTASASFQPNPLLPDTRSEMAVPLVLGEKVVGVLDMQSAQPGSLKQDDLVAFEALAGQLAVAIQNANLLADVEQARADVEKQAQRLTRENWLAYSDAIHAPEHTGFVYDGSEISPLMNVDVEQPSTEVNTISVPIEVTGEPIGSLVVEGQRSEKTELVAAVVRQVAQQIESLRLLESAERYRMEAEKAARLTTMEGWKQYIESRPKNVVGYVYDSKEVKPLDKEPEEAALTLPIKVRDETVGKFSVQEIESQDEQSLTIAQAVIGNLGAHIENLRLLEETQRGQIELNKRAQREQTLRQITSALRSSTNPETIMRTAVRELGSILGRRTVVQMMSPEQDAQAESSAKNGDGSAPVAGSTESA